MKLSLEDLNESKRKAVEELRLRVKDIINQDIYEDILLFHRFLEAREWRINDAENMLRKHIIWRKVYQVDTIEEDFKPKEFFLEYVLPKTIGFDKQGCLVLYSPVGNIITKEIYKCEKKNNLTRHWILAGEHAKRQQMEENKKSGRNATQFIFIMNAEHLTFENTTSKETIDLWFNMVSIFQDNNPEFLKAVYLINAPSYVTILLTIVKALLSKKMIMKINHFGTSGWKEKLLEIIDADTLPAFLGGNRTDPDGNPLCRTVVCHGGKIPAKYFLPDKERYFKNGVEIKKVIIPPSGRKDIFVDVKEKRTLIQWEFYCKNDINFGLFHEQRDKKLEEVIPIARYDTSSGTEKYFHRTHSTGKYIIVFENTSTWLSKKEVEYCIDVLNPDL